VIWLGFQLAAEEVERRLGLSWGAAQKTLLEACENGEMKWQQGSSGPDVLDEDFHRWLGAKLSKPVGGKQARVIPLLREMLQGQPVPPHNLCPRKRLRADLLRRDRSLNPLDLKTLQKAIKEYNAGLRS
jgi:hypothetical protein